MRLIILNNIKFTFFLKEKSPLLRTVFPGGGWEIRTPAPGFPRLTI